MEGKGGGVITQIKIELLCEYVGELMSYSDGVKKEQAYSSDPNIGCYMYFFKHTGKTLW